MGARLVDAFNVCTVWFAPMGVNVRHSKEWNCCIITIIAGMARTMARFIGQQYLCRGSGRDQYIKSKILSEAMPAYMIVTWKAGLPHLSCGSIPSCHFSCEHSFAGGSDEFSSSFSDSRALNASRTAFTTFSATGTDEELLQSIQEFTGVIPVWCHVVDDLGIAADMPDKHGRLAQPVACRAPESGALQIRELFGFERIIAFAAALCHRRSEAFDPIHLLFFMFDRKACPALLDGEPDDAASADQRHTRLPVR